MAAAFLTGVFFRFVNLGAAPLSDFESGWALKALEVSSHSGLNSLVTIDPQPAYIFLTSLLFKLLGDTNFSARFWPAVSGSLLLLAPFLLKNRIGKIGAVVMLVGLAIDPGLVAVSRLAGGPMLAVSFTTLSVLALAERRPLTSGILAGAALLSGPAVVPGLIGLGLTAIYAGWKDRRGRSTEAGENRAETNPYRAGMETSLFPPLRTKQVKIFGLALFSTILVLGTCLMQYPQGLAAWAQSLVEYFSGWAGVATTGPLEMAVALPVLEPFTLGFALLAVRRWGFIHARESDKPDDMPGFTALFLVVLYGLLIFHPSRQIAGLVWLLPPLWLLASWELRRSFWAGPLNIVSALQAGLIIILASLVWFAMVSPSQLAASGSFSPLAVRLALLAGIISLGFFASILIALGWSPEVSRLGAVWGITAIAVVSAISAMWGASQTRANQPAQLWSPPPGIGQQDLLIASLEVLSNWNTGRADAIQVVSLVEWPSMRWELRGFENASFVKVLTPGELPAVIITRQEQAEPALAAEYRGQDFIWRTWPTWQSLAPADFLRWLAFGEAQAASDRVILWGRSDQFLGERNN